MGSPLPEKAWKVGGVGDDPYPEDLNPEAFGQLLGSATKLYAAKFFTEQISAAGLLGKFSGSPGGVEFSPADQDSCNTAPVFLSPTAFPALFF